MKIVKAISFFEIFLALLILPSCLPLGFQVGTPTPIPDISHILREIREIELIWSLDNASILWNRLDATMEASSGRVCFLGDLTNTGNYYNIVCLDSRSGDRLWEIKSEAHTAISTTPGGVYVVYGSGAQIRKYEPQTGNLIWRRSLSATGSHYLYFLDNRLQVLTTSDDLWILNTDGERMEKLSGERFFISTPEDTFINLRGIQAVDSGGVVWEHVDLRLLLAPIFTKDKIFIFSEDDLGKVYALDRKTGTQLWTVPNIFSNIAYSPEKQRIYALRRDGNLLAIDENTGTEKLMATFSGSEFLLFGPDVLGYQLAYDKEEHILLISLGDSSQIFAFEEK